MEFHTGSQALKVPPKIAISHVFVILGGNILRDKAQELFLFSFLGRVPVIFHWISEGLCNSSFIEKIFNIKKLKKRFHMGFFCNFMNLLILERKFPEPEMSLSLKYI